MTTNKERQKEEIEAISSICDKSEFFYHVKDEIECHFNIFLHIEEELEVRYTSFDPVTSLPNLCSFSIKYLPPVRLLVKLPNEYPSRMPPEFLLNISWIPPWKTSFVCQEMDEIWQKNGNNEILYSWFNFLKNDLLSFLNIDRSLDVTFSYVIHESPFDYFKYNWFHLSDIRALNRALFLHPMEFLAKYDKDQHKVEFTKTIFECVICMEKKIGKNCTELKNCRHIYCTNCIRQYICMKINEGLVRSICCPDINCRSEITIDQIRSLCPMQFTKYEELLLKITLATLTDIYCPRKSCQYPAMRNSEQDTLVICGNCNYSSCFYCHKGYHGVAPCAMTLNENMKLIQDYEDGDRNKKQLLEKIYGRKQIQIIVEKHLTREYLKDNTKPCPNCQTSTVKIDGCNKMICSHCQASFCWLCGKEITSKDPYNHFMELGSECYRRLFVGIIPTDDELIFEDNF